MIHNVETENWCEDPGINEANSLHKGQTDTEVMRGF